MRFDLRRGGSVVRHRQFGEKRRANPSLGANLADRFRQATPGELDCGSVEPGRSDACYRLSSPSRSLRSRSEISASSTGNIIAMPSLAALI